MPANSPEDTPVPHIEEEAQKFEKLEIFDGLLGYKDCRAVEKPSLCCKECTGVESWDCEGNLDETYHSFFGQPVDCSFIEDYHSELAKFLDTSEVDPDDLDNLKMPDYNVVLELSRKLKSAIDSKRSSILVSNTRQMRNTGSFPISGFSTTNKVWDIDVNIVRALVEMDRIGVDQLNAEGESILAVASSAGHYDLVKLLFEKGASPDYHGKKTDNSPLMEACANGHVEVAKLLISYGADVNKSTSSGSTPLHLACSQGSKEMIELLVAAGARLDTLNDQGHNPLMEAASSGNVEAARVLINSNPKLLENPLILCTPGDKCPELEPSSTAVDLKESPLTLASYKGHCKMVSLLLEEGRRFGIRQDELHTALMEASMDGHIDVVKLLLDFGADINFSEPGLESPLSLAANGGHYDLVVLLLNRGANIEDTNEEGVTALMEAAREGHLNIVQVLIKRGADVNAMTEETFETALTLAASGGWYDVVVALVEAGADLELGSPTPLIEAASDGHPSIVHYLLSVGANVHATTSTLDTAFTASCESGNVEIAEMLLQAGAVVDHTTSSGQSALMKAARNGHLAVVEFLLKYSVDINRQTIDNDQTVLSGACAGGHASIVRLLLQNGADPLHILKDNVSMLMEASRGGHVSVAMLLMEPSFIWSDLTLKMHAQQNTVELPKSIDFRSPHFIHEDSVNSSTNNTSSLPSRAGGVPKRGVVAPSPRDAAVISDSSQALVRALATVPGSKATHKGPSCIHPNNHNFNTPVCTSYCASCSNHSSMNINYDVNTGLDWLSDNKMKAAAAAAAPASSDFNATPLVVPACPIDVKNTFTASSAPLATCSLIQKSNEDVAGVQVLPAASALVAKEPQCATFNSSENGKQSMLEVNTSQHMGRAKSLDNKGFAHPVSKSKTMKSGSAAGATVGTKKSMRGQINNNSLSDSHSHKPSGGSLGSIDVNAYTDGSRETALTIACNSGHFEMVNYLLKNGAAIEHRDKRGYTPLMVSAYNGSIGICKSLLDASAHIEAHCEKSRETALTLACSTGRVDIIRLLLNRGANIEHRTIADYTPLTIASNNGHLAAVNLLLERGADANPNKHGITPLMLASMSGHGAVARTLLEHGADPSVFIESNRNTALTLACFQGKTDVVSMLLEHKANCEHRSKSGLTPLMEAANGGFIEIGALLIKAGADVNAPPVPNTRESALTIAAEKGHDKFVELLLKHRSNIEFKNKRGCTALWLAASGGFLKVVQVLDSYGACLEVLDGRDVSALVAAFRKGHQDVVRYLVGKVSRFPSENDCKKYISTLSDKELQSLVSSCCDIIMEARSRQEAEADKYATDLLKEISLEKVKMVERRAALARKRDKKKKRKSKNHVAEPTSSGVMATAVKSSPIDDQQLSSSHKGDLESVVVKQAPPTAGSKLSSAADSQHSMSGNNHKSVKNNRLNTKLDVENYSEADGKDADFSDSEEWRQVSRKSAGSKSDHARKMVRTQIPTSLVSRFIGKAGASINAIREKTNTVIDIDTVRKTSSGDCTITIKGFTKDIKSVLCILTVIINEPDRTTLSILNGLESVRKTAPAAPFVPVSTKEHRQQASVGGTSQTIASSSSSSKAFFKAQGGQQQPPASPVPASASSITLDTPSPTSSKASSIVDEGNKVVTSIQPYNRAPFPLLQDKSVVSFVHSGKDVSLSHTEPVMPSGLQASTGGAPQPSSVAWQEPIISCSVPFAQGPVSKPEPPVMVQSTSPRENCDNQDQQPPVLSTSPSLTQGSQHGGHSLQSPIPSVITSSKSLCPGAGRSVSKPDLQNYICPLYQALYDGKYSVGITFDKEAWNLTSYPYHPCYNAQSDTSRNVSTDLLLNGGADASLKAQGVPGRSTLPSATYPPFLSSGFQTNYNNSSYMQGQHIAF